MVNISLQEKAKFNLLVLQAVSGKDKGKIPSLVEKNE